MLCKMRRIGRAAGFCRRLAALRIAQSGEHECQCGSRIAQSPRNPHQQAGALLVVIGKPVVALRHGFAKRREVAAAQSYNEKG